MESELKNLQSNPTTTSPEPSEPIDDGSSSKDDLPLLKPDLVSDFSIEELEKKYAAFVRRDVYGTMGRGELPWVEKLLLAVALFTLVPLRVVLGLTVLVIYFLICRICTAFLPPNREDGQEDYAHMGGWRRTVIVQSGRFLSRVMLLVFGFYWIRENYQIENNVGNDFNGKVDSELYSASGYSPEKDRGFIFVVFEISVFLAGSKVSMGRQQWGCIYGAEKGVK